MPQANPLRLAILLTKKFKGTITEEEKCELEEWAGSSDKHERLYKELTDRKRIKKALKIFNS